MDVSGDSTTCDACRADCRRRVSAPAALYAVNPVCDHSIGRTWRATHNSTLARSTRCVRCDGGAAVKRVLQALAVLVWCVALTTAVSSTRADAQASPPGCHPPS